MSFKTGDILRIPFRLFDTNGTETIDTVAANYVWPLHKDGAQVVSPSFTVTRPIGTDNELLLNYTLPSSGKFSAGKLAHVTAGYTTNLRELLLKVTGVDEDDIARGIAVPAAAPTNTVYRLGDKLYVVRGDSWSQIFTLYQADGVTPRDLTGLTYQFRVGYRTAANDSYLYSVSAVAPSNPTAGQVTITILKTDTADAAKFPVTSDLWYDLQETSAAGALLTTRGIGQLEVIRDVGPSP